MWPPSLFSHPVLLALLSRVTSRGVSTIFVVAIVVFLPVPAPTFCCHHPYASSTVAVGDEIVVATWVGAALTHTSVAVAAWPAVVGVAGWPQRVVGLLWSTR